MRRKSEQDIIELVKKNNGKIIEFSYENYRSGITVLCNNGHQFTTSYDSLRKGCWCKACSGNLKHSIAYANSLAIKNGGICVSDIYRNNRSKLIWRCKFGHEWNSTLSDINRGRWCPICSSGRSEEICRFAFESVFGLRFPKVRPSWLVSDKNTRLELDGYCKELSLAFEHNGLQHYQYVEFFKNDLESISKYDNIKRLLCKSKGIRLIEIPQLHTITSIKSLIEIVNSTAKDYGINPKIVDFENLFNYKYQTLINVANKLGLECLSREYLGAFEPLRLKCIKCNHEFDRIPASIIHHERSCPKCKNQNKIFDMIELAKSKNGRCLSDRYIRSDEKLTWMCEFGHIWKATPSNVKRGHWCQKCHLKTLHLSGN